MEVVIEQAPLVEVCQGSEKMLAPHAVQRMLALSALGWGAKRISRELGCSPSPDRFKRERLAAYQAVGLSLGV